MFLWMTALLGIVYPLLITGVAEFTMKEKAQGGLLVRKGEVVGASLIAQKFVKDHYFWPRPSFIDYQPLPSGGSNLGPTSAVLKKAVDERRLNIMKAHGIDDPSKIPIELLFASGSGLDPHISLECAYFQMERVGKARNLDKNQLLKLIDEAIVNRGFGVYVNVLHLNLSLDK